MKMTKKRIIIGLFLFIIVIIWIIFYCFYPSKDQVGDEINSGKYFDSAYDAYKDDDVYPYSKIEKELATININERFAMWIASTNHNEFIFAKMSLQNNQYCSLCDYAVIKVSNCNDPRLNEENTLGRNDIIKYTVLPYNKFNKKSDLSIKMQKFDYNNQTYVFAYRIVHKN